MAVPLENRMLGHREKNIEIAAGTAAQAGSAFARKTDAGTFLHARRHVHIQHAFLLHRAGAAAGLAGMANDLASATAGAAAALDGEEALGGAHLAMAGASGAGLRIMAGLGARALTGLASDGGGHLDLGAAAAERLFQGDG